MQAVLNYAFDRGTTVTSKGVKPSWIPLECVEAEYFASNIGSGRVLEKCCFISSGVLGLDFKRRFEGDEWEFDDCEKVVGAKVFRGD